jgi:predicted HicB family RNase H-like nuclease
VPEKTANMGLRLPESLADELRAAAENRGVSLNRLVTALLAEGLERLVPATEWRFTQ